MTGKDFLANAAGSLVSSHLLEIAGWMDICAEKDARIAELEAELAKLKPPAEAESPVS